MQRSFGPQSFQLQMDSTDTFFFDPANPDDPNTFDRRRHYPSLTANMNAKKFKKTGLVFAYEGRAEALQVGNQDHIDKYDRFDINPRVSRPLSRPFVQLTPQVQLRYTHYGSQVIEGELDPTSIDRKYVEGSLEMRGPSFSRVFNTPGNFYSERFKHTLSPEVTYTYRSKFEEFDSIPRFDYLDFFPGTNEVRYGLVNQIYAKRHGKSGKLEPYELFTWRVGQTYYVDLASSANLYDPNYSSAVFDKDGKPAHLSPLQSRLRFRPTPAVSTNFDLEYDVNFKEVRSLSLSTSVNYRLFGLDGRWFRGISRITIDKTRASNTMRGSGRVQLLPGKLTATGSVDYDVAGQVAGAGHRPPALRRAVLRVHGRVHQLQVQHRQTSSGVSPSSWPTSGPSATSWGRKRPRATAASWPDDDHAHPRHRRGRLHRLQLRAPRGAHAARLGDRGPGQAHLRRPPREPGRRSRAHRGFSFVQGDIADPAVVARVLPGCHYVVNFAAETHVDRSLYDAGGFIQTDVYGAFVLLEEARRSQELKLFVQISTDEVYGSVEKGSSRGDGRADAAQSRTPRARRAGTGWPTPTSRPTGCRSWSRAPPTTTDPTSSRRRSSRSS